MAILYDRMGDHEKAVHYLKRVIKITEKIDIKRLKLHALSNLGINYHFLKNSEKAIYYHRKAYDLAKEMNRRSHCSSTAVRTSTTRNTCWS